MKTRILCCCLLVAAALNATPAVADIVVSFNDLGVAGVEVIIADNSAAGTMTALGPSTHADSDAAAGIVGVPVGLTAGSFLIDPATTGFSLGGGVDDALLDLLLLVESTAPGTLQAMITDTDLTLAWGIGSLTGNIGGFSTPALGGSDITYQAGLDPANNPFSFPPGSSVGPVAIGGGTFGTTLVTPVSGSNPFSLSENITIIANSGGQIIGFDASATGNNAPNPEPTTVLLWSVAGVACGVVARRKARASAARSSQESAS